MAFANINLTESVPAASLSVYGSGAGQFDVHPTGVVCFGIASVALTANATVYINPADGTVTTTKTNDYLTGVVECNAAIGDGVWVKVFGLANGAYVVPTVASGV